MNDLFHKISSIASVVGGVLLGVSHAFASAPSDLSGASLVIFILSAVFGAGGFLAPVKQ